MQFQLPAAAEQMRGSADTVASATRHLSVPGLTARQRLAAGFATSKSRTRLEIQAISTISCSQGANVGISRFRCF